MRLLREGSLSVQLKQTVSPYLSSIDKIGTNSVGLENQNDILKLTGAGRMIGIVQSKYLNNIAEKDHCVIKRIIRPTLVFKSFHSVAATLAGMKQLIWCARAK